MSDRLASSKENFIQASSLALSGRPWAYLQSFNQRAPNNDEIEDPGEQQQAEQKESKKAQVSALKSGEKNKESQHSQDESKEVQMRLQGICKAMNNSLTYFYDRKCETYD